MCHRTTKAYMPQLLEAVLCNERPLQWDTRAPQLESSPSSPQLQRALAATGNQHSQNYIKKKKGKDLTQGQPEQQAHTQHTRWQAGLIDRYIQILTYKTRGRGGWWSTRPSEKLFISNTTASTLWMDPRLMLRLFGFEYEDRRPRVKLLSLTVVH